MATDCLGLQSMSLYERARALPHPAAATCFPNSFGLVASMASQMTNNREKLGFSKLGFSEKNCVFPSLLNRVFQDNPAYLQIKPVFVGKNLLF